MWKNPITVDFIYRIVEESDQGFRRGSTTSFPISSLEIPFEAKCAAMFLNKAFFILSPLTHVF